MSVLVPVEPSYRFAHGKLAHAAITEVGDRAIDVAQITALRDQVSDEQCGKLRECWTRPSAIPGCGAQI